MNLIYRGKTKDVYALDDGNYLLSFKDDCTGENGVFDPGANTVGLCIDGAGQAGLRLTNYFFDIINKQGVPTHYIEANIEEATMKVKPAVVFGQGLEVICRFRAVGSFLRRYGKYVADGQPLNAFVEITLKDDDKGDPPITEDALDMLGIMTNAEYRRIKELTKTISFIIKNDLATRNIELYDIKLEFGKIDQEIVLIDEISGGNMRAFKDGVYLPPLELEQLVLQAI